MKKKVTDNNSAAPVPAQVTRAMSLTVVHTSDRDRPSIGWLELEDKVPDGVWSRQVAMGRGELSQLWFCPLVQDIVSKSAPYDRQQPDGIVGDEEYRYFELTEKAFKKCEKLVNAMMPDNWELSFTSRKKARK